MLEKEKLLEIVARMLSKTAELLEKGASILADEIPKVVQEYLTWKFTENMVYGCIQIAIAVIVAVVVYRIHKWCVKENFYNDTDLAPIIALCYCVAFAIIGTFLGFGTSKIMTAVQIKIAPRVFLIEESVRIYGDLQGKSNTK
jgi:predicted PurR-regulated permease PerM